MLAPVKRLKQGHLGNRDPQHRPIFRAIALRRDQTLLTLSSLNMLHAQGFPR